MCVCLYITIAPSSDHFRFSFFRPRPDEPANIRATISQKEVKLGETLSGTLSQCELKLTPYHGAHSSGLTAVFCLTALELVDQYENPTKTLSPSCVTHMTVEAEGLDSSAVSFTWLVRVEVILV